MSVGSHMAATWAATAPRDSCLEPQQQQQQHMSVSVPHSFTGFLECKKKAELGHDAGRNRLE